MAETGRKGKAGLAFICGTPNEHCSGKKNSKEGTSTHATSAQVRQCTVHYYVNVLGYKRRGPRELEAPARLGGAVLVLNRHPPRSKGGKADDFLSRPAARVRPV